MPTLKKTTTKTVAKRSRVAVSPATRARVQKRTNRVEKFTPRRESVWHAGDLRNIKAEVAAKREAEAFKYNGVDLFQTSVTVGLAVLVVCMFAWR